MKVDCGVSFSGGVKAVFHAFHDLWACAPISLASEHWIVVSLAPQSSPAGHDFAIGRVCKPFVLAHMLHMTSYDI